MKQRRTFSLIFALVITISCVITGESGLATTNVVVGSLGDSISAAFNAQRYGDNRELSWASGSDASINSHALRISTVVGRPLKTRNEALTGSVVTDLENQVTRLLRHSPDYVTISIGSNDICSWPVNYQLNLVDFESELTTQIERMINSLPNIRIYIAAIPNLYNLWQVAHQKSGCQRRWETLSLCRPLLAPELDPETRQLFLIRWQAANQAVDRVASRFPGHVIHDGSIGETFFTWEHVSPLDCFHPSPDGQRLLAELSWVPVAKHFETLQSKVTEAPHEN